jgi:hypothetical protein
MNCELDEIKKVMKMNLGEWELLRMIIVYMREKEIEVVKKKEELS